jgi:hypothetical protein
MTVARTVADVLADHVVFEVECIDRMYCNVYVPQLQYAGGLLGYIQRHLGLPIASTAPLGKITDAFTAAMRRFARDQQVPWVDFSRGQRKDDVMHEHLARFTAEEGCCSSAGIGHTALDNGFATCEDPAAVQAICNQLGPAQIDELLRKWLALLPHPFTAADREAGYRYDISILQAEFSLTQVLDRPISGRVFFEHVIRDNLDAGRPDQISLIFDRALRRSGPRPTPGTRLTNRDHDQQPRRLRHQETADQSARAAGDRRLRQPAPARRPTTQPQPDPRRGSLHRRAPPHHHRHRSPHRRAPSRRSPRYYKRC